MSGDWTEKSKVMVVRRRLLEVAVGFSLLFGALAALTGCNTEESSSCTTNEDCPEGEVCSSGICLESPGDEDATSMDDVEEPTPDTTTPDPDTGIDDTGTIDTGGPDTTTPPDTGTPDTSDTGPDLVSPDAGMVGPQVAIYPPNELDFGTITVPTSTTETLVIENVGDATLNVTRAELAQTPSQGFSISGPSTPQNLSPGQSIAYDITFDPNQQARYQNQFVVETNDRDASDRQREVTLSGFAFNKVTQPCLYSTPETVDFGVVQPGNSATEEVTVGNCSVSSDVTVTAYNFLSNPDSVFSIDPSSPQPTYTVGVNQSKTIEVQFSPTSKRSLTGELSIRSDETTGGGDFIDLMGSGGGCAEAEAKGRVPNEDYDYVRDGPIAVKPNKGVELDGTDSTSPSGQIDYDWTITNRPSGSSANLSSTSAAKPTLNPSTAGVYDIELQVTNTANGTAGCVDDTISVVALDSDPELQVSSTWNADHDLNVHVVRSDTNGNFPNFRDSDNDLYTDQPIQNWDKSGSLLDDGFHLGDSTGGSSGTPGAERAFVSDLENNRDYRIALHFRDADGFRPRQFNAETTIEVQGTQQQLSHGFTIRDRNKFWISFEVDGTNGSITQVDRER